MSDERRNINDIMPQYDEYSVAALLQEYTRRNAAKAASSAAAPKPAPSPARAEPEPKPDADATDHSAESIADRSRRIAMSAMGETLRQYQSRAAQEKSSEPDTPEPPSEPESPEAPSEPEQPAAAEEQRPRYSVDENGVISLHIARPPEPEPDSVAPEAPGEPEDDYAAPDGSVPPEPKRSFSERFLAPVVRMVATRIARRQMQSAEASNWPEPVDIRETPELSPGKAAKYYTSILRPLTLRFRVAVVLTLILVWISMRLPMGGMLGGSLPLQAGVSLVLLLTVMMTALDVVTTGLRQLFDLKPGAETLATIAAILSCADAALVLFGHGDYLPYCAIGATSLCAALWGEVLRCRAMRRTFRTVAAAKKPSVIASDMNSGDRIGSLMRSERDTAEGVVRRSESQDLCRTVYATAAPFMLGAALLLSIGASLGGNGKTFLHTFSALVSVSASFTAFFGFPLPYAIASRKLRSSGAALAGYAGCADIGKTRRIVITDEDLFPPGTMKFSEINVAEGVFLGKVVSSTASLLAASGSGVSSLFDELVTRRGYRIPNVEEFVCHEGGGLSGLVNGERVQVGSAGFMNLMGIRLPQNLQTQNSICTAISGDLVGVFVIDYIPVTSVQDALVTLMRGKTQTVFAIRDFNITPRMIGKLFRMPTDNFNFPSFRERYRIVGSSADVAPIDAVVSRAGMLPMVEAAESGRKVWSTCRTGAILSLVGAVIGMIIMFLLCRVGSFDTASAGNVLSFMLLWSLPALILSLGQNR